MRHGVGSIGAAIAGAVVLCAATPLAAQRYSNHPDPAHPDAFAREQARVRVSPAGAALVAAAALAPAIHLQHRPSAAERARRVPIDIGSAGGAGGAAPPPPASLDLLPR